MSFQHSPVEAATPVQRGLLGGGVFRTWPGSGHTVVWGLHDAVSGLVGSGRWQ